MNTKSILITGANRDLGLQLVELFYRQGYSIYCTARNERELNSILEKINVTATTFEVDFTNETSVKEFYDKIDSLKIDNIIHSASIFGDRFQNTTFDDLKGWSNFSLTSYLLAKYAEENFSKNNKVIFIGSIAGHVNHRATGYPMYSIYKASLKVVANKLRHMDIHAHYINLGGFRDHGDGIEFLPTSTVCEKLLNLIEDKNETELQIDLMGSIENVKYGSKK